MPTPASPRPRPARTVPLRPAPICAFEILFFLGYLAAVPTLRSALIISVWIIFQCLRFVREEGIIDRYEDYRQTFRWRLIPFVW